VTLEPRVGHLGRDAGSATAAALAGALVAGGLGGQRGDAVGAVEHLRQALGTRRGVRVLLGVAQQGGRDRPTRTHLFGERAEGAGGSGGAEQRKDRVTLAALDAARQLHLFLVGQDAAAARRGTQGLACGGRRNRVVRDGTVGGEWLEPEGLALEILSLRGEGCVG
jgi:hypothetical protein